jgi:P-type Ca2+ transporter type 2C
MQEKKHHRGSDSDARDPVVTHGNVPRVEAIHTVVRGRARFKVHDLYRADYLKQALETGIAAAPWIRFANASPLTGTLLVLFDANRSVEEVARLIAEQLLAAAAHPTAAAPIRSRPNAVEKVTRLHVYRQHQNVTDADPRIPHPDFGSQAPHALGHVRVLSALATTQTMGLSAAEAAIRLLRYGPNLIPERPRRSGLSIFLEQFMSLPVGLLGVSAAVSLATGGLLDAAVILCVVLINAGIGYVTESQAEKTINALAKVGPHSVLVLRDQTARQVPASDVVVGDILLLFPGARVPADARLLQTNRLSLDESPLTGESMPVSKDHEFVCSPDTALGDRRNMVYMGTMVTGGSGLGVVVATGVQTELGRIQSMVGETRPPDTPMQVQLNRMGTQLALLSGAVCGGVFVVGLLRGYSWLEMLKASISLAVAAVPEGLPAVATTTLALGIKEMRRHQVAVRHLAAVETLGAVQVFCLDKTGTLTLNRMTVVAIFCGDANLSVKEGRFILAGEMINPAERDELLRLLQIVTLCSETEFESGEKAQVLNGSATENAMVEAAMQAGIDVADLRHRYARLNVQYRSEGSPYMRTVHQLPDGNQLVAVKGSPAEVLAMCTTRIRDGARYVLDEAARSAILLENERMAGSALRVLGVAYADADIDDVAILQDLIWLGLIGMTDPIRDGMEELIHLFHRAGIKTVMITGDQSATAYAVGRQLRLSGDEPLQILDSTSLEKIDPALMAGLVQKVNVFARVSPSHKLEIVQALQRAGNVVAMTGDGINDGPALKAAEIGVAMGGAGSEVAHSVSDVVLENDNLQTMVIAVSQGRTIYGNIRKALHFLLATNFTEIEVMLAGVALGQGQALNPMQLLWINLISDIFPGLALSLEPPEPDILERPPRDPSEPIIRASDLKRMALESAVISTGSLAGYGYGLMRYGPGAQAGTIAFTTLTFGQLLHAISCRSDSHSIFRAAGRPSNPYLNTAMGVSIGVQVLAAVVPGLRSLLGTTPLNLLDAVVVGAGATLPLLVNEATKFIESNVRDSLADARVTAGMDPCATELPTEA